eukprot:CAMPEP_0202478672 /NCGR_PEP_ID=MMETSP1360-20130828/94581_2 /ASSEMBLY_ACC=CAM_ASM_000848 /TAXON_ID=515479 /ORGANISM="Licmophora paradoxa, Strain CCMP2313" /LENGTH=180 /DNA_ID=CAMNT_0049105957 /DNA_START=173 /DNA_END=712 /DNA_ORIENTATION=-
MFVGRKRSFSSSSFGPNGKRNKPDSSIPTVVTSSKKTAASSCKVFKPKPNISFAAQKAPLNNDVSVTKKFQRPMTKRRAYNQRAEQALKISSLGSRKRMDGMSKLMARAGRGLSFKLPSKPSGDGTDSDSDTDNEKESKKEDERPFEPLMVWQSPHQGGVAIGLPPRLVQEKEEDEFGIE